MCVKTGEGIFASRLKLSPKGCDVLVVCFYRGHLGLDSHIGVC